MRMRQKALYPPLRKSLMLEYAMATIHLPFTVLYNDRVATGQGKVREF